ncbi:hypothetical protein MBM_06362 [Drepanopeziza brunnea f. sp. 'multigermtubi' MB_m1]|uniref:Uncharacterized protein n=1 Tax=Marssonina brunnea f. sp. multigermtubi (strain MB_m1) TaxID=1072389 RepID=K1WQB6_MARBU|nr:uncharacterized protein MBM_06362 [Drepanopeziza brunnea f. sp. 'multigermtubi' MB_m1]EKD15146.1 hypothetical protein MBM_06362 [Drepanopeziza brunnea f. sp. 'multigermtubi' MB_m1]
MEQPTIGAFTGLLKSNVVSFVISGSATNRLIFESSEYIKKVKVRIANLFVDLAFRGRGRPRNPLSALAIAAAAAAAAAAAILRILTFEPSPFPLDLLTKRLLIPTTVKALRCINNCTIAFTAANTAFDNFLALDATLLKGAADSPGGLTNRSRGFRNSPGGLAGFALALKTFNLNIALVKLNSLIAANRNSITRSASSISLFPLALAPAAFIVLVAFAAPVALAAPVASVALIIVALFALIIALAAFAAAPAVAMTLAKRRIKVKRLLRALVDLLL